MLVLDLMKRNDIPNELEMVVAGLVLDPASNAPIIILKDPEGATCLPIWIGVPEASSIATALKNIQVPRPLTHDLLKESLELLGARVTRVSIVALKENTFFARIEIVQGEVLKELDARPSDALALAIRCNAPIYVSEDVLIRAKATLIPVDQKEQDVGSEGEKSAAEDLFIDSPEINFNDVMGDSEIDQNLDQAGTEGEDSLESDDSGKSNLSPEAEPFSNILEICQQGLTEKELKEVLAEMDPLDFKYKM